jgi:EmrB/QacA subfamily drug resistance transporter
MSGIVPPPCDNGILRGAPNTPGCASHAKRWVLAVTVLGSSTSFIAGSAINVALPAIQRGVSASMDEMQWIGSIYTLPLAALTMAAGSAGDLYGRRRIFMLGLAILAASSAVAGFVTGSSQMILARAAQGLGAALLVPNSLALLSAAFPKPERGRAIGTWSAATSLTGVMGPVLGGVLVDSLSWRAAFFVVVPLAVATLIGALVRMPDVHVGRQRAQIDWWGIASVTAGLVALVFGIISLPRGATAVGVLAAGLALLLVFVWHETRATAPMLPPRLFRSRDFLGANLLTLLLYFAVTGIFFVLPFALTRVHGYSAAATGAAYLPFALALGGLSRFAGGVADRIGTRVPMIVGPLVVATGFLLLALPGVGGSYWTSFFPPMLVIGLGMAMTVAPLTSTVMAAVDERDVGVASGVNNTVARASALLAVAIFGLVALAVFQRQLDRELGTTSLSPAVREAVLAQRGGLGDVTAPAGATATEREAVELAAKRAFVPAFRFVAVLAALLAAAGAIAVGLTVEASVPKPRAAAAEPTIVPCGHADLVLDVAPRTQGCEECLRSGEGWVHLRVCLSCGHVGCCDSSRRRHATAHFWATAHPIVRSLQPGETWRWCYVDETTV